MKRSPRRYTTTPMRDKIPQKKQKSASAFIVELSTAVVKVHSITVIVQLNGVAQ